MELPEFLSYWREAVFEAVMLVRQAAADAGARCELAAVLRRMGARTIALCLSKLWFFETFNFDFKTGEHHEAAPAVWDRLAAGLRLSPAQVRSAGCCRCLLAARRRCWVCHCAAPVACCCMPLHAFRNSHHCSHARPRTWCGPS